MTDEEKYFLMEAMAYLGTEFMVYWEIDLIGYTAAILKLMDLFDHSWTAVLLLLCLRPTLVGLTSMLHHPLYSDLYPDDDDDDDDDDDTGHGKEARVH